jgi:AcrR family transcriptional regulator
MPKETFYNLDENKKVKIIKAAIVEFTNHELHKARVSNIIKVAGIPRGSFYQYFEDIDDLYYFIIDDTFNKIFEEGNKSANETNDLFEYTIITFKKDLDGYTNDKRHKFIKNVVNSIGDNTEYLTEHNKKRKEYINGVLDRMDLSNIRIKQRDELVRVYELLQNLKKMVIHQSIMKDLKEEESIELIKWHIDLLKKGLGQKGE